MKWFFQRVVIINHRLAETKKRTAAGEAKTEILVVRPWPRPDVPDVGFLGDDHPAAMPFEEVTTGLQRAAVNGPGDQHVPLVTGP